MNLPNTYTNVNKTNCCAVPNINAWDKKLHTFKDKYFIRMYTKSLLHIPLNMSKVMTALYYLSDEAGAQSPPEEVMILSHDLSPWKAEQLYSVTKPINGLDNVTLNGKFLSLVFEGPYYNMRNWYDQLIDFAKSKGMAVGEVYFFYTTCPKCAKYYGKNYTIGLIKVA